jgi:hypothetical protein
MAASPSPVPDELLRSVDPYWFWSCVEIRSPDECWPWTKGTNTAGYGYVEFRLGGNKRRRAGAHRVAYILSTGLPLGNLDALHSCDNPPCCNPRDLRSGTQKDNSQDMSIRGRGWGPKKLTPEEVAEVKQRYGQGETSVDLAQYFAVNDRQIRRLVSGTSQKHDPTQIMHPAWKQKGFRKAQTKLSDAQITELRRRYAQGGISQRKLASIYKIDQGYLSAIINFKERTLAL